MMNQKLESAVLGAWTFFASAHAIDVCGLNGLPLTPNSIRILGQFQKLKTLSHCGICAYLDAKRGKHERVMIVSEYFLNGLHENENRSRARNGDNFRKLAFEITNALSYLHLKGIIHRCLSPQNIRLNPEGHVKLSSYGLYYMTEGGSTVSFPIGTPKYLAPEVISSGPFDSKSSPKSDIWSMGIILLEVITGAEFFKKLSLQDTFRKILSVLKLIDHLANRPFHEVYYLWQLAGGDLEAELRRQELIKAKPPVVTISKIVAGEGEEFGLEKDRAYLLDVSVLTLPLEPLKHRLRDVDPEVYYPLTEYVLNGIHNSSCFQALIETAKLPLIIKEKDVEYQLHRNIMFKKQLEAYPYKRAQILYDAKVDVPPLYRPWIWAALLEIEGDVTLIYDSIDKETVTPTDRQIEVDIPRCHQYDELLSSPIGHQKFKRILKAWVVSHPQYVYWQGLDSLCAPFLSLNFNDEALAYACLSAFIPKYLYNFFLKDNSSVIQEYLAKFSHLIAYHDPQLTNHLDNIGFIPELYAIPWFLTMYTHVFPLHKIFHLWDTLLLGDPCFPLCIGVAILKQLRNNLLSYGFNECILMFSDMPEIDIQRCVQDSKKIFCSTPKSITYRMHENPSPKPKQSSATNVKSSNESYAVEQNLVMTPVPLEELKSETCARISAEDLLDFLDLLPGPRTHPKSQKIKIVVVDIRSSEEYCRGSLENSINVPFSTAFSDDGSLGSSQLHRSWKGKLITVIGSSKDRAASEFATKLVRAGYSYVCTLHGGIEVLRRTGLLIAKTSESYNS
ncbi:TBC domain-containing protein kinase-like protein [Uloborus diversus]|uniref:TBC domain-containing protein kinase-like protein n=1 Tax=Uloborus diversus TaxID=327109 RepID=UPI00240A3F1B|nr:TBC domain-containing protein kinase-like protein [Uloborus diversus]